MAKKQAKAEPVHEAAKPKIKEDPGVVFTKFLTSCTEQQRKTIFAVDATLKLIQTDKKKLRRELQPLRVGMELSKVREIIVGRSGKANPQQESGRIWGGRVKVWGLARRKTVGDTSKSHTPHAHPCTEVSG